MKQFATWFTHGVPGGAKLRAAIYQARTGEGVLGEVEKFFAARLETGGNFGENPEADEITSMFPEAAAICD